MSLHSMYKILNHLQNIFYKLKNVTPRTDENKDLQQKVLNDVGDFFNELFNIYKDRYYEEKDGLKTINKFTRHK